MKAVRSIRRGTAVSIFLLMALAVAAMAQENVGALHGVATDTEGVPLPGVQVTLDGIGAIQIQVSDDRGQFRFLGLDPGSWSLEARLDGFSMVEQPAIDIRVGASTRVEIRMPAVVEEVVTVTSEGPLLDERKISQGTLIRQIELEAIPTARDPWAVVNQAPGVIVDRINVGGNESGQQSGFRTPGNESWQNDFLVDGVQITDMASLASPTYYDFGQFSQVELGTGGSDVTKNTAGVSINMVTKRGSNEFRGSVRFLLTDRDGYFGVLEQAEPSFSESDLGPGQTEFVGNTVNVIQDYGFEAGGPLWRNRVWLWAAWGNNNININAGGGTTDRTVLENITVKLNAQFTASNSFVGSFNNGDKRKFGRGAQPSWDASATWNQRGPTGITKLEDTHVFGSNFFVSGQYSFVDGGFGVQAQGGFGPDQPAIPAPGGERNTDALGIRTNNGSGGNSRPVTEWKIDGSYFFNTNNVSHELKFGGRMREAQAEDAWSYPGRNIFHTHGQVAGVQDPWLLGILGLPPNRSMDAHLVYAYRQGPVPIINSYQSAWVQDTMTMGKWTFNVGLRYDLQDGENGAGTVDANIGFPEVMPALVFPGNDGGGIEWRSFSPRLGVTYALGAARSTLLRASLSQFPNPMASDDIYRTNPVSGQLAYMVFLDEPGGFTGFYDDGEPWRVLGGAWGFDPADPAALETSNLNDPGLDPPTTTELIVGVEHAFLPELVAGLNLTWRRKDDFQDFRDLFTDLNTGETRTATAVDYIPDRVVSGTLPDGSPYSQQTFAANPTVLASTGGKFYTNGVRAVDFLGAALTLTKRLTNQWMLRGFVNYNLREEWNVPKDYFRNNDPNRMLPGFWYGSILDGETFVQGGGEGVWLQSNWQWNLNGMYQVAPDRPWGFNIAANLYGRQGYPNPYFRTVGGLDGIGRDILVLDEITDFRNDNVHTMDLRFEKEFRAASNTSLTFSVDCFNILNDGFVLARYLDLGAGNAYWIRETLSPRIWRLGVRLNWR